MKKILLGFCLLVSSIMNMSGTSHDVQENIFKCTYPHCDKSYNHKASLIRHVNTKHLGKKTIKKRNECPYENCTKSYIYKDRLVEHIKVKHNKESRTIRCKHPQCKKTYSYRTSLERHILSCHKGETYASLASRYDKDNCDNLITDYKESNYTHIDSPISPTTQYFIDFVTRSNENENNSSKESTTLKNFLEEVNSKDFASTILHILDKKSDHNNSDKNYNSDSSCEFI